MVVERWMIGSSGPRIHPEAKGRETLLSAWISGSLDMIGQATSPDNHTLYQTLPAHSQSCRRGEVSGAGFCGVRLARCLRPTPFIQLLPWGTPLCPAGHLPHRWGDWLGLPARSTLIVWRKPHPESISLLVGEMSGRTEGGNPRHAVDDPPAGAQSQSHCRKYDRILR